MQGQQTKQAGAEVWLGGESHMPGLSQALRRRDRRSDRQLLPWVAGAMLCTGLALGSLITLVLARSRR